MARYKGLNPHPNDAWLGPQPCTPAPRPRHMPSDEGEGAHQAIGDTTNAIQAGRRYIMPPLPATMRIHVKVKVGPRSPGAEGGFVWNVGESMVALLEHVKTIVAGATRDVVQHEIKLQPSARTTEKNFLIVTAQNISAAFKTAWERTNCKRNMIEEAPDYAWTLLVWAKKKDEPESGHAIHRLTHGRIERMEHFGLRDMFPLSFPVVPQCAAPGLSPAHAGQTRTHTPATAPPVSAPCAPPDLPSGTSGATAAHFSH